MGFSFARSVKLGPLRVNVSKRGLGVSAGVKGARVSVGPRGTYVTLGRGGFRYQTKLGDSRTVRPNRTPQAEPSDDTLDVGTIHTASALELAEASPHAVLEDIQRRVHRFNWFKAYSMVVGVIGLPLLASPPALVLLAVVAAVPGFFLYRWNQDRRTARLYYDVDNDELLQRLAVCNAIGEALSRTASLWHIYSSIETADRKRHAGASALVKRTDTSCHPGSLPGIELNVEPWSVTVGPQQLLFLPDRLLVHEKGRFAAVGYDALTADFSHSLFVEDGKVPADGRQVDVTWRYVNKSGGPDRRFNDNRQLPILQYGRLTLTTPTGMTIILEASNADAVQKAQELLKDLRELSREQSEVAKRDERPQALSSVVQPQPQTYQDELVLRNAAIVLKFIAAADRRISDEEIAEASSLLRGLSSNEQAVQAIVANFKSLSSNEADAKIALLSFSQQSFSLVSDLLRGAEAIASADGRVTPKERERLGILADWIEDTSQATA